jgi:hypothetical protein
MKAFPTEISFPPGYRKANYDEGMDLRDYFASGLMKSFLTHERVMEDLHKDDVAKTLIKSAYQIADLMMEIRKNEP